MHLNRDFADISATLQKKIAQGLGPNDESEQRARKDLVEWAYKLGRRFFTNCAAVDESGINDRFNIISGSMPEDMKGAFMTGVFNPNLRPGDSPEYRIAAYNLQAHAAAFFAEPS